MTKVEAVLAAQARVEDAHRVLADMAVGDARFLGGLAEFRDAMIDRTRVELAWSNSREIASEKWRADAAAAMERRARLNGRH